MADKTERIQFEADMSGFTPNIITAANALKSYNEVAEEAVSINNKFGPSGQIVAQSVKLITDSFKDLNLTQVKTKDGFKIVSASLTENTQKVREAAQAQRDLAEAFRQSVIASGKLADFKSDFPGAGALGVQGGLSGQERGAIADANALRQQAARRKEELDQFEIDSERRKLDRLRQLDAVFRREDQAARAQQEAEIKAFIARSDAIVEASRERKAARAAAEAKSQSIQFGNQQFAAIQGQLAGAAPGDVLSATGGITTIQQQIASGAITAARATEVFNKALAGTPQLLSATEQQVARAALATQAFSQATKEAEQTFNLGWKSIVRIAAIQLLHSGIYSLINALKAATTESINFQIKISEIRTISQDTSLTFEDWAKNVRTLSDEFARPAVDVAAGAYETVSNQIAKGADATVFLEKALRFSQATVSTTAEAVDLLSSAINAYQLNASDADRVSAVLFKTIDLGRVRASEMASTFGRVAVPASQLGISLEETSAAIATLTINGVKASESFSQLNTLFVALLKPSDAMKKFFQEIGVASGEAAISTFGFEGVIKKLADATNGSSTELAALVKNARGLRGAIGLTSDFEGFQKNLQGITGAAKEFDAAVTIATESAGFKLQKELNKTKNAFLIDFGIPITETIVSVTDAFGGLSVVLGSTVRSVATLAEGFVIYKAAIGLAALAQNAQVTALVKTAVAEEVAAAATKDGTAAIVVNTIALRAREAAQSAALAAGLSQEAALAAGVRASNAAITTNFSLATSFRAVGASLVAVASSPLFLVTAGLGIIQFVRGQFEQEADLRDKLIADFRKQDEGRLRDFTFEQEKERSVFEKGIKDKFAVYGRFDAEVLKLATANADLRKQQEKEVSEATKAALEANLASQREAIREEESLRKEALENIKKAQRALADAQRQAAEQTFQRQLSITPEDQRGALVAARQKTLESEAAALFRGADQNPDNLAEGIKKLSEAHNVLNDRFKRQIELRHEIEKLQIRQAELDAEAAAKSDILGAKQNVTDLTRGDALSRAKTGRQGFITTKNDAEDAAKTLQIEEAQRKNEFERNEIHQKLLKAQKEYGAVNLLPQAEELAKFKAEELRLLQLQKTLTEQLSKVEQDRADRIQEQVKADELRSKNLQQVFKDVAEFKLPTKALTGDSLNDSLKQFDELIQRAKDFGLTDQATLFQLQKDRAAILKQGAAVLTEQDVSDTEVRLRAIKDAYIKTFNDIESRRKAIFQGTSDQQSVAAGTLTSIQSFLSTRSDASFQTQRDILQTLIDKVKTGNVTAADQKTLLDLTKSLPDLLEQTFKDSSGATRTLSEDFQKAATAFNNLIRLGGEQTDADRALKQLNQAAQDAGINLSATRQEVIKLNDAGNVFGANFTQQLRDLSTETQFLNQHLRDLKGTLGVPTAPPKVVPGQGFAIGGGPRGVDTVPAWLRPGEFVMNPGAAQQFYPLLKAMNLRGQGAQYFANGGEVNFGGVEINVVSSGSADVDARELWDKFETLARRGLIRM